VSELIGEVGAGLVAKAKNYIPTNFPRKYHGIESVFEDGGKLVIVEAKGGAANLAEGQMSKGWINQRIQKLIDGNDPLERAWGNKLRTARDSGNLQGMVVTTRIDHAAQTVADPEFVLKDWSAISPSSF
jgi:hypothetical protein